MLGWREMKDRDGSDLILFVSKFWSDGKGNKGDQNPSSFSFLILVMISKLLIQ